MAGRRPAFQKIEGAASLIHLSMFRVLTGGGLIASPASASNGPPFECCLVSRSAAAAASAGKVFENRFSALQG